MKLFTLNYTFDTAVSKLPVENFLMFDNAYKNDQKVHFFVNLYTNICQRNMQKETVDIIRLIVKMSANKPYILHD